MMKKKITKQQWYDDVLEDGAAKAPAVAPNAEKHLEGLNRGEIHINDNSEDPTIFIRDNKGNIVKFNPSSGGEISKDIRVNAPKTGHIETGNTLKKGLTYEQIFRTMLYKPEPATFIGKISTANDVEIGSAKGTLTYIANQKDNGALLEGYYMNDDNVKTLLVFSDPDDKGDMTATRVLTGFMEKNETYKAFADFLANETDNLPALSLTSTISVNARRKWFAGTANAIPADSASVRSLPSSGFMLSTSFRFSVQRGVKRIIFCFPAEYTLIKLVYDGVISGIVIPMGQLKVSTINEVSGDNGKLPIPYTCCAIVNDIENLQDATDNYTVNLIKS